MRQKKFVLAVILLCFGIIMQGMSAGAMSATFHFSSEQTQVSKGAKVSVTLTVDADIDLGEIEGYIYYSPEVLEFKKGGSCINGSDGVLRLYDGGESESSAKRKYVLSFTAKKVGMSEIYFKEKPSIFSLDEGAELSASTGRLTIQVAAGKDKSSNANLKSLKISPGILTPDFDKDITEYKTNLTNDTESLVVSGVPEDKTSDILVKGNQNLKEGENRIILTIEAENGDQKEYIIRANKEVKSTETMNQEEPKDTDEGKEPLDDNEDSNTENPWMDFEVIEEEGKQYIRNSVQYELAELEDESLIPEGYMETSLILYGTKITAYTRKDNLEDDFLLIYAINKDGDKGFYQYDRVEKTLQRYRDGAQISSNGNANLLKADKYQEKVNQLSLIIAILSAVSVLLLIVLIRMLIKAKGYKDDFD